ncbi:MAG: hypothetical protein HRT63_02905 [Erythrobacter sp.]|nr:hypothetical protein [Erythrobacter sp.]
MENGWIWLFGIGLFWLVALAIRDARRGDYLWAGVSAALAIAALFVPYPSITHSVEINLPQGSQ